MVTFVPQQASNAVGVSKVQPVPHSSVRATPQLMLGGLVSMSVTISVQNDEFEQQSVACQLRVMTWGQGPFVTALTSVTVTLAQQASNAVGGTSVQPPGVPAALPHLYVWLLLHVITGGMVSTTFTKLVQNEMLLQQSLANQT